MLPSGPLSLSSRVRQIGGGSPKLKEIGSGIKDYIHLIKSVPVRNWRLLRRRYPEQASAGAIPSLSLESPFKLSAALKFGLIFLALNVVGGLAQRNFGPASFYFVSIAGGLLSSASSIASAATLITHHKISATTGVNGIILSSLTSILINVPLIRSMTKEVAFKRRVCLGLALVAVVGLVGVGLNEMISVLAPRFLTGS